MATKYFVLAGTDLNVVLDVKSKRQQAIDIALAHRAENREHVVVVTGAGTIVAEAKVRKAQKKTRPYTRVAALPEGFEVPEGKRVAYVYKRSGVATLHDFDEMYSVFDYAKGETLATFDTTRQCGRFVADVVNAKIAVNA